MKRFKYYQILIFLLVYTACATHNPRANKNKEVIPQEFIIIGHRGTGDPTIAPENTLSSFRFASKQNAGFELDTMFVKSGELIVIHDDEVDRTTKSTGKVADLTLTEIKSMDAGIKFSEKFKGEKIPTLTEVLNEFGGKTLIDIEIKANAPREEAERIGEAVALLVKEKKLENGVIVTSFNPYVLGKLKEINPEILRGQIYSDFDDIKEMNYFVKVILRNLWLNRKAVPDVLVPRQNLVNEKYVKEMHDYGYKIIPWTVNDPKDMERLIVCGVDGLITDRPDIAKEIYAKLKQNNQK